MQRITPHRGAIAAVAGILMPLGIAGLLVPFRMNFADASASLVLVAVVTVVAIGGTRLAGYLAALSAAIWFDFFLTRPYERLVIDRRPRYRDNCQPVPGRGAHQPELAAQEPEETTATPARSHLMSIGSMRSPSWWRPVVRSRR